MFSDYILGSRFEIEMDHKPLVPVLSSKHLNDLPPRVLRFRLRIAKISYSISHVPGGLLFTADALPRDPIPEHEPSTLQEIEVFVNFLTKRLPASEQWLEMYCQAQERDGVCTQLREYCKMGWLRKKIIPLNLTPYWKVRNSSTICNDLLLYNPQIIVMKSLQRETLQKIHSGHLGIEKCKKCTTASV